MDWNGVRLRWRPYRSNDEVVDEVSAGEGVDKVVGEMSMEGLDR